MPVIHECFSFKIVQEVAVQWKEKKRNWKGRKKERKKEYISSVIKIQ